MLAEGALPLEVAGEDIEREGGEAGLGLVDGLDVVVGLGGELVDEDGGPRYTIGTLWGGGEGFVERCKASRAPS